MLSVLVTGGAGYLGSVLCEHLLRIGYQVIVVDNLLYQQHSLFHLCANPDFEFVLGDVRDEQLMRGGRFEWGGLLTYEQRFKGPFWSACRKLPSASRLEMSA